MKYSDLYVKRIRSLCKQRRISINKLASMSNVKQSTLDNIVSGVTGNPRAKTLYLPSDPAYAHLSSTMAREKLQKGESLEGVLAENAIAWIKNNAKGE